MSFDKIAKRGDNHFCLHDRLMFEIKQKGQLNAIKKSLTIDSNRKRIRPIKVRNIFPKFF
jgi:hypothetical protein